MTIVRDGDDYLYPCIAAVAPYVKKVQIILDSRSSDNTQEVLETLKHNFDNVEYSIYPVTDPARDLVEMRNKFFPFEEKWGFIVDSDEYHYGAKGYEFWDSRPSYAFLCYAIWSREKIHKSSSRPTIGRVFRNSPGLKWSGPFGNERLYDYGVPVFDGAVLLPHRYIHFTHIKKEGWREEMKKKRVADSKYLSKTPEEIINIVDKIHEAMPDVRFREV